VANAQIVCFAECNREFSLQTLEFILMKMTRVMLAAAAMSAVVAAPAFADGAGVKVGFLTCNAASGWGFIFGSSRSLKCEYSSDHGGSEHYNGTVTKFGADIGYLSSAVIVWGVVAPTANIGPGTLGGSYAGVTGSAAAGIGVGANVLVGGSDHHITLQPVSIEGQTGLNVAGGVESLELKSAK
jgi:hypothetical protein